MIGKALAGASRRFFHGKRQFVEPMASGLLI